MNDICKLTTHLFGERATHSLARLERRLTLSLLLAGNGPASSTRSNSHPSKHTIECIQLRILGLTFYIIRQQITAHF